MDEAEISRVLKVLDDFIEVREKHPWFVRDYLLDYADLVDYETCREAYEESIEKGIGKGQELKAHEVIRSFSEERITSEEAIAKIVRLPVKVIRSL